MVPLEVLRKSEMFEGLTDEELIAIARMGREETYEAGACIVVENETAKSLYVVREGRIAILIDIGRGRQTVVDMVVKGGSFSWSAMVPPHRLTGTAKAVEQSKVIAIPSEELRELCKNNCSMCYTIMEKLATIISVRLKDTRLQLVSLM